MEQSMKAKFTLVCLVFLGLACLTHPLVAADTIHDAKDAIQDAGRSAASSIENLWHRIDESRLKNRTRDEIIAWMMMGMLVGGVAGSLTSLATSGLGRVGRILLGLGGAFVGGIIMRF